MWTFLFIAIHDVRDLLLKYAQSPRIHMGRGEGVQPLGDLQRAFPLNFDDRSMLNGWTREGELWWNAKSGEELDDLVDVGETSASRFEHGEECLAEAG